MWNLRRNDLDICADILRVARRGAKKTHLVYRANLNFSIVKKYIMKLTEGGFLEAENGRYFTTEGGVRFLEQYEEISSSLFKD
ncbi:MAG: winged helix-turn-helix domain-containing protein [Candidatus Bathyarchaeota archaeon]|nr:winged helix-turn-helix domain-containing protein [Candidatus Bathyarchaeota archaeon]